MAKTENVSGALSPRPDLEQRIQSLLAQIQKLTAELSSGKARELELERTVERMRSQVLSADQPTVANLGDDSAQLSHSVTIPVLNAPHGRACATKGDIVTTGDHNRVKELLSGAGARIRVHQVDSAVLKELTEAGLLRR